MGSPRILAVGTAVPATSFTQDQLVDLFGYADARRRSFFSHSGIERRHFFVDAAHARPDEDVDQLAARFEKGSVALGTQAIHTCLDRGNLDVSEVDFLATTTCTGRLVPSLDTHLIRAVGLRADVQRVHVGDTGCASAVVALQQAFNYLHTFPGRRALVVAVELCSTTYTLDDSLETAVANAIFADGAAAILLGTEGQGPAIVGHRTVIRSEYLDRMGFTFPRGRARVRLSKENANLLAQARPLRPAPPGNDEVSSLARAIEDAGTLLAERQAALVASEEKYRALAENFPNGAVATFDRDLRFSLAEGRLLGALGFSKVGLEGRTIWEAFDADRVASLEPLYRAALDGESSSYERQIGDLIVVVHDRIIVYPQE